MKPKTRDESLRRLLRSGDPLPTGERLPEIEAQAMRRKLLAAAPAPRRPVAWRWALTAAAVAVALAGVQLLSLQRSPLPDVPANDPSATDSRSGTSSFTSTHDEPRDRQVQFITRGGTRVIWMLKPKID